jgi:hypothetical protein
LLGRLLPFTVKLRVSKSDFWFEKGSKLNSFIKEVGSLLLEEDFNEATIFRCSVKII